MASIIHQECLDYRDEAGLDRLIEDIDRLISLPNIYYQLEALIEKPDASLTDFSRLLSTDTDLCARLLRLANSAFFSFPVRIETIDKAIQIIGLRQVRELVMATSIVSTFENIPFDNVNMQQFWRHAITVGVYARTLARSAGMPAAERYYLAGLLHDIGRLVLYLKLPGAVHQWLTEDDSAATPLFIKETRGLGYSHDEIGGRLLQNWRLPQAITEAVQFHHHPERSSEFRQECVCVYLANARLHDMEAEANSEPLLQADDPMQTEIGLDSVQMEQSWHDCQQQIQEVITMFKPQ